jgi:hypothetical protein
VGGADEILIDAATAAVAAVDHPGISSDLTTLAAEDSPAQVVAMDDVTRVPGTSHPEDPLAFLEDRSRCQRFVPSDVVLAFVVNDAAIVRIAQELDDTRRLSRCAG